MFVKIKYWAILALVINLLCFLPNSNPSVFAQSYPKTFTKLTKVQIKEIFDEFNKQNGGNWIWNGSSTTNSVAFNDFTGLIGSITLSLQSSSEEETVKKATDFIWANKQFFGVVSRSDLNTIGVNHIGGISYYFYYQPSYEGYNLMTPFGTSPADKYYIELFFSDGNNINIQNSFYPLFLPSSPKLTLTELKKKLIGQTYTYTSGCEGNNGKHPCDQMVMTDKFSSSDTQQIKITKTAFVPVITAKANAPLSIQMRLLYFLADTPRNVPLYADVITGELIEQ